MSCVCDVDALAAENAKLRTLLIDFEYMLRRLGDYPFSVTETQEVIDYAKKVRTALVGTI